MTQFRFLFTLDVSHSYDPDGSQDFDFVFSRKDREQLKRFRIIPKIRQGRLFLLFEATDAGEALNPAAGETIRIGLQLRNLQFFNFTKLDFDPQEVTPLYNNSPDVAVLSSQEKVVRVGKLFRHRISKTDRPVTVSLVNFNHHVVRTETVSTLNNRPDISYDLTNEDSGIYRIQEVFAGETVQTVCYVDPEFQQMGVFCILEVTVDQSFYTSPPDFHVPFHSKQEPMKYYVVAKKYSESEFNQLDVVDTGFAEDGRTQVNFTKVLPASFSDEDFSPVLLQGGDDRLVLFRSTEPVARRKKARKHIQLKKNGEVLIAHLPHADSKKGTSDLIIHLSKP